MVVEVDSRRESKRLVGRTRDSGGGGTLAPIQAPRARVEEDEPLNLDRLLLWLSAKEQGSWSQFRAAVEELCTQQNGTSPDSFDDEGERSGDAASDLPIYQQVRFALQRLGHVEFYTAGAENGWRVVPPTVAFPTDTCDGGLLCGARSPALFERLHQIDDIDVLASELDGMPQRILLRGTSQDMVAARARTLGLQIQRAAPIAILSVIPSVRDPTTWHRSPMPETPGWFVHRFSVSRRQWLEMRPSEAANARTGLFRFALKHQRFYYLRWHGCLYRVPVQVGKYAIMRKRAGILQYDVGRRTLSTLPVFRPPLLIERALVFCSGRLGQFDPSTGRVDYPDVPRNVAHLAAQLLRQEIR